MAAAALAARGNDASDVAAATVAMGNVSRIICLREICSIVVVVVVVVVDEMEEGG